MACPMSDLKSIDVSNILSLDLDRTSPASIQSKESLKMGKSNKLDFTTTIKSEELKPQESDVLGNAYMDGLLHLPDVRLNLDDLGTSKVTLPTLKNPFLKILTSNAATNVDHAKHESTPKRKPRTLKSIGMIAT